MQAGKVLGYPPDGQGLTGGARGWVGDSPFILLDASRIRALGWRPSLGIREAVLRTLDDLVANPWLLEPGA